MKIDFFGWLKTMENHEFFDGFSMIRVTKNIRMNGTHSRWKRIIEEIVGGRERS